jgi:hypothetical protein
MTDSGQSDSAVFQCEKCRGKGLLSAGSSRDPLDEPGRIVVCDRCGGSGDDVHVFDPPNARPAMERMGLWRLGR